MVFQNGNTHDLNDPDRSYFITKTQLDTQPQIKKLIHSFLNDMKYKIKKSDMKSDRYNLINKYYNPN